MINSGVKTSCFIFLECIFHLEYLISFHDFCVCWAPHDALILVLAPFFPPAMVLPVPDIVLCLEFKACGF